MGIGNPDTFAGEQGQGVDRDSDDRSGEEVRQAGVFSPSEPLLSVSVCLCVGMCM